jgi:hypothetical protein
MTQFDAIADIAKSLTHFMERVIVEIASVFVGFYKPKTPAIKPGFCEKLNLL